MVFSLTKSSRQWCSCLFFLFFIPDSETRTTPRSLIGRIEETSARSELVEYAGNERDREREAEERNNEETKRREIKLAIAVVLMVRFQWFDHKTGRK